MGINLEKTPCPSCGVPLSATVYHDRIKGCQNFDCDKFKSLYSIGEVVIEEVKLGKPNWSEP